MAGRNLSIAMGLAAVLASAGCASRRGNMPAGMFAGEDFPTGKLPASQIVRRSYRLRKGDQLEIMHHVRDTQGETAKMTEAIKTVSRGENQPVTITPDGTISLPFIAHIQAAGKTLAELRKDLNDAYRKAGLEQFDLTVNVQTISPIRIHVLGEVRVPGTLLSQTDAVDMSAEITLLQAIAQAGGYIPGRADLSKVMLIRRRNLPNPQAAIVNLRKMLKNRERKGPLSAPMPADSNRHLSDVWLADGDIIYVPTTKTAKRSDYLDYVWTSSIRAIGGFASSGTSAK